MPRLADLLSENSDVNALRKMTKNIDKTQRKKRRANGGGREENGGRKKTIKYLFDYVAVDVETTGLDCRNDRIIEVGLARFRNGKPEERYLSFVNPGIPVPAEITSLTGIENASVMSAPAFIDIADKIVSFIGNYPLCGHQVEFDFNFINQELKRGGRDKLSNSQLDTAVLSRIVLPALSGYSLSQVARHLSVDLHSVHRAMDDAMASGKIAAALIPMLKDIPYEARRLMGEFAPPSIIKKVLFDSVFGYQDNIKGRTELMSDETFAKLSTDEEPRPIDEKTIEDVFADKGELFSLIEGYSSRKSQIEMALNVTSALNMRRNLVAEAGAGTGKSLAYLVPAGFWAYSNKSRVLVSTYTRNLQDQLVLKDLPVVKELIGNEFRYSVLKGRSNYLCIQRWNRLLSGEIGNLSRHERFGILPLIRWAGETRTGDIEEQNQFNRRWFPKVWNLISADSHTCKGWRCRSRDACYLQRARQKALSSHIVVINHALFFSDVCAESSFLGRIGPIIFDEAHHLESCGHKYLRVELDTNRINRYVEFLGNLSKILEKMFVAGKINDLHKHYKSLLKRLRKTANDFLGDISYWATQRHTDSQSFLQLRYDRSCFSELPGLAGFKIVISDVRDILLDIRQFLHVEEEKAEDCQNEVSACLERTSQLKADLDYLTSAVTEDHVFWVEGDREKGWIKMCGVSLDVGSLLSDIWERGGGSYLFTSATISVSGSMDFFCQRAGIVGQVAEKTDFKIFKSPFSDKQLMRCAVSGSCDPTTEGYAEYVASCVTELLKNFNKNILALFTSNEMLYAVNDNLKKSGSFPGDGKIFAQVKTSNRYLLLDQFKNARRSVLLGTDSFWEGVDAPGQSCEIVLIARLPFSVPTHPLAVALSKRYEERFGESFLSYSVPEAVIKFKQGAGRLIRTQSDKGVLIVMDPRIVTKGYGRIFMRSLPGEFVNCSSVRELVDKMTAFFSVQSNNGELYYVPVEEA